MSRKHLISRPIKNQDIAYEDLEDRYDDWKDRSRVLEQRRWHKLKNQMRNYQN